MHVQRELSEMTPNYAIYSLSPEDAQFSKRIVSTKICVSTKSLCPDKLFSHNVTSPTSFPRFDRFSMYKVYNYDKNILSCLDNFHNKYRSVVFSYPENKLMSFSPPKSIEYNEFIKTYPKIGLLEENIIATEKIEGISINLFYDSRIQSWEINTKTNIGGNYWYFMEPAISNIFANISNMDAHKSNDVSKSSTFYDMFLDALIQPRNTNLNDNPWIHELPKNYCYSFVLQHPENQIIVPIKSPKLWLVAIYEIRNNCAIHIPFFEYRTWPILMSMIGVIDFPRELRINSYEELQNDIAKYKNHPFRFTKGIVLWNEKTGDRTLLNNPIYNELSKLREIFPGFQYEYFCMKHIGKIAEYLEYFPHYRKKVLAMENIYDDYVKTLHACYMNVYVFKTEDILTISDYYRLFIEELHKTIYLPSINTRKPVKITKSIVKSYISRMEPREQLYIFSYLRREPYEINN
jgi:hypothetical protein